MSGPAGVWKETKAEDGRSYYYNTVTNATTWERPAELGPISVTPAHAWRVHQTEDGKKYYEDTFTKKTQWTEPDVLKAANNRAQQAPSFTAASTVKSDPVEFRPVERGMTDRQPGFGSGISAQPKEEVYSLQEAEGVFNKLLKRAGVQSDWTWARTLKAVVKDPAYRAYQDPKDRKAAFERYIDKERTEEKEREKERQAKLRDDFVHMLKAHPNIFFYTRWVTARPMIEEEMVFKAARNEDERITLFDNFRVQEYKEHLEQQEADRKSALTKLSDLIRNLDLTPLTPWAEAQKMIKSHKLYVSDDAVQSLPRLELIKAFEAHQQSSAGQSHERRQKERFMKVRHERQNRDQYIALLRELQAAGKINANTTWSDIQPLIEEDSRYKDLLGQSGSSPLDLFWDILEEEERVLRDQRNIALDALEAQRYEMTMRTSFEEFKSVMQADRTAASWSQDTLRLVYDRLRVKLQDRVRREREKAEQKYRNEIDDLRSRMKRVDPPIMVDESWEKVRPRLEKYKEYQALDSDDLRRTAFDKYVRRLKEREQDKERDYRNGHSKRRRTATPEVDAYEADRRKAQIDRERTYGKRAIPGVASPPPRSRDWDRDAGDRYDGRDSRKVSTHHERDRRERDGDRERSYISRADPKDSSAFLDYDDDRASSVRRRRESDEGSTRSNKRLKRVERERRTHSPRDARRSRTRTPAAKEPEQGFHSGSEEGEIEED